MSELEDRINSLLSDPDQLGKIAQMAQSFMGGGDSAPAAAPDPTLPDPKLMATLTKVMSKAGSTGGGNNELLKAMKPYLAPKRREKMDRALRIAQLAKLAGLALSEYGGSGDGDD